jgi:hypothetical protein
MVGTTIRVRQLDPSAAVIAALGMPAPTQATPATGESPGNRLVNSTQRWSPDGKWLLLPTLALVNVGQLGV